MKNIRLLDSDECGDGGDGGDNDNDDRHSKILQRVTIVGGSRAKKKLLNMLEKARLYEKRYKDMNISPDIGVLLYGLPGVGKSELAKQIMKSYSDIYPRVKVVDIPPSSYLGKRTKGIGVLKSYFDMAMAEIIEKNVTYVILIDEIDSLCPKRGKKSTGIIASERTEAILKMIDIIRDNPLVVGRLFIIGTTNLINRVDPAMFRAGRFKRVSILLPNRKERIALTKMYLGELEIEIEKKEINNRMKRTEKYKILDIVDIGEIVDLTEGFSGADFMTLKKEMFDMMIDHFELGVGIGIDDVVKIINEHALDSTNAALMEIARFEAAMIALEDGEGIGMGLMEPD